MSENPLDDVICADDYQKKLACVLLIDTSGSMGMNGRIRQVNEGLKRLEQQLKDHDTCRSTVEIAIVTFGNRGVRLAQDFVVARDFEVQSLESGGATPMGEALKLGWETLLARLKYYKSEGIPRFNPMLVMMTDGGPTDDWKSAVPVIENMEAKRLGLLWSIGVEDANFDVLKQLGSRQPMQLGKDTSFVELFDWVSASLSQISQSTPGQQLALPNPADYGMNIIA